MRLKWGAAAIAIAVAIVAAPAAAKQVKVIDPITVPQGTPLRIVGVDLIFSPAFEVARAKLDEKAAGKRQEAGLPALDRDAYPAAPADPDGLATLPFKQMFPQVLGRFAKDWGLADGRPVRLRITFDKIHTADLMMAWLIASSDELDGTVEVVDEASQAPLGRFRVDVVNAHSGLAGMAIRGGGVREKLAEEFSLETTRFLSGRKKPLAKT